MDISSDFGSIVYWFDGFLRDNYNYCYGELIKVWVNTTFSVII